MYPYSLTKHLYNYHRGETGTGKADTSAEASEPKPDIDVTCKFCGKEYSQKSLVSHYRRSHPELQVNTERKMYACTQCEEKYLMLQGKGL